MISHSGGERNFALGRLGEDPVNNFTGGICLPVGRDFEKVAHGLRNKEKAVSARGEQCCIIIFSGHYRMVNYCLHMPDNFLADSRSKIPKRGCKFAVELFHKRNHALV
jgi:hypothetical protein